MFNDFYPGFFQGAGSVAQTPFIHVAPYCGNQDPADGLVGILAAKLASFLADPGDIG